MSRGLEIDISLLLDRFTLSVRWQTAESSLGIFGPSGAGKTTILETLAGLRAAARGVIRVDGRTWLDSARGIRLPPERRGIGYVPQDLLLFPHRDVMGNLRSGRRRAERAGRARIEPRKVLEVLELADLAGRDVRTLSGGERRRVALGRALCSGPELLLLDEPLANLDLALRRRILPYLFRVREEFAMPTLHVSHDATEIKALCREVMVLAGGRTMAHGPPDEIFATPSIVPMTWAEGFENVVRGMVTAVSDSVVTVDLEPGVSITVAAGGAGIDRAAAGREAAPAVGSEAILAVRAEELILATQTPTALSAQNILAGTIRDIREARPEDGHAGQLLVGVAVGRLPAPLFASITTEARRRLGLREGMPVTIVCKAHSFRILATR